MDNIYVYIYIMHIQIHIHIHIHTYIHKHIHIHTYIFVKELFKNQGLNLQIVLVQKKKWCKIIYI